MIQYYFEDEDYFRIYAEDQCWDERTLKQLWDEHRIVFMSSGDAVTPVMLCDIGNNNPLVAIGTEDDGKITFEKRYGSFTHMFSTYWIDSLVADLQELKRKANEIGF